MDVKIDHFHNGLPYDKDGNVVVGEGPVAYVHAGVAFNADGQVIRETRSVPRDPSKTVVRLLKNIGGREDNGGGPAGALREVSPERAEQLISLGLARAWSG